MEHDSARRKWHNVIFRNIDKTRDDQTTWRKQESETDVSWYYYFIQILFIAGIEKYTPMYSLRDIRRLRPRKQSSDY